jgi:prevent-host-death family protein
MHTVNISDFRANLLKYMEKAHAGEQVFVTTNGKLLAAVIAPPNQKEIAKAQLADLATTAKIHDVMNPINEEWGANL